MASPNTIVNPVVTAGRKFYKTRPKCINKGCHTEVNKEDEQCLQCYTKDLMGKDYESRYRPQYIGRTNGNDMSSVINQRHVH